MINGMFCFIPAKHLALNGCLSAYPSREVAKKSRKGRSSSSSSSFSLSLTPVNKATISDIDDDDDKIESYDPNEVMAKAYMKSTESKEEKKPPGQEGPLAFLGLQRKSSVDNNDNDARDSPSKVDVDSISLSNNLEQKEAQDKPSPFDELLTEKQPETSREEDSNPATESKETPEEEETNPLHDSDHPTFDEDSFAIEPRTLNGVNDAQGDNDGDENTRGSFNEDSNTSLRTPNPPLEDLDSNTFDDLRSTNDNLNGGTSGDLEGVFEDWNEVNDMEPLALENDDEEELNNGGQ